MAPQNPKDTPVARPGAALIPSFSISSTQDAPDRLAPPKRAHTIQNGATTEKLRDRSDGHASAPDAFDTSEHTDNEDGNDVIRTSVDLDDLPIELITLTDRCV